MPATFSLDGGEDGVCSCSAAAGLRLTTITASTDGMCLCTIENLRHPGLPKIFVDVVPGDNGSVTQRYRAVVDTGSTRSIVSKCVEDDSSLTVCPVLSEGPPVALDGKALSVLGTVTVQL